MPLLDHFHPPLSVERHWESLHTRWASAIMDALNENLLPDGYFAESQVHIGSRVEIDVATFEEDQSQSRARALNRGGVATLTAPVWAPAPPSFIMPAVFPDSVEVLVISTESGPTRVAAVELVSPGNKDRVELRRAFAAKCASYVQQGVGLVVVDIVTNRAGNMHNELVAVMQLNAEFQIPAESLYAVAYHPTRPAESARIEVWSEPLTVGGVLPLLPLALDKGQLIPLDLEATYTEACQRSRLS